MGCRKDSFSAHIYITYFQLVHALANTADNSKLFLTADDIQKQPSKGVYKKRCSENMQQIYRRTTMPKCDFNKVAFLL